jgi:hypothetical protein
VQAPISTEGGHVPQEQPEQTVSRLATATEGSWAEAEPSGGDPDPHVLTRDQLAAFLHSRTTVSVPFAGACCGISRASSYAAAKNGSLRTLRLGHRLLVPTTWLEDQLGLGEEEGA